MAVWASKVYLRWYKAFNTETIEPLDGGKRPWNKWNKQEFRYVEVPLSSRICTIVGGNETGKSQLLGAIQKLRNGATLGGQPYTVRDICRYSGLLSVTEDIWPGLGIEFSFDTLAELQLVATGLGATVNNTQKLLLRVFINGAGDPYATFFDCDGEVAGTIQTEEQWIKCREHLPQVQLVRSDLELQNQVHISQLIAKYDTKTETAYEPVGLNELAKRLVTFDLEEALAETQKKSESPDKPIPTPICDELGFLQKTMTASAFTRDASLEYMLFRKILGVEKPILERIRSLKSDHHGYIEQLKEDINHRLKESLDISEFWQQDEDFQLIIEYKGGFFYFLIADRTGAKYTFEERSGGLQFFLSYYIQLKAIRDSLKGKAAIVLMDEPDGFLSAAGQRNLLSVFELIARPGGRANDAQHRCQVIYSTHSPFLINRNYPDRISLVRKGDGGEGTQLVELVATRQYEPIRTGLGIESAETLFMGAENVVVEEISAHRLIVAAIQRFGDQNRIDDMLDLNKVTIVSASGAWDIVRLLRATKRSKEKSPVTVVFLDGDATGQKVYDEVTGEGLIAKNLATMISSLKVSTASWCEAPQTLEDLVPPVLLCEAAVELAKHRWGSERFDAIKLSAEWRKLSGPSDGRLADCIVKAGGPLAAELDSVQLRAAVFKVLADGLLERGSAFQGHVKEMNELEAVMRECCRSISNMLEHARTASRQDRLLKSVRLEVERYRKLFGSTATKADVLRCLNRLDVLPVGASDAVLRTRENLLKLRETLNNETAYAGLEIDAAKWVSRFETFMEAPWHE